MHIFNWKIHENSNFIVLIGQIQWNHMKPKSIHIYSLTAKTWRIPSRGKRMRKGFVLVKYFFVRKSCIKSFLSLYQGLQSINHSPHHTASSVWSRCPSKFSISGLMRSKPAKLPVACRQPLDKGYECFMLVEHHFFNRDLVIQVLHNLACQHYGVSSQIPAIASLMVYHIDTIHHLKFNTFLVIFLRLLILPCCRVVRW